MGYADSEGRGNISEDCVESYQENNGVVGKLRGENEVSERNGIFIPLYHLNLTLIIFYFWRNIICMYMYVCMLFILLSYAHKYIIQNTDTYCIN